MSDLQMKERLGKLEDEIGKRDFKGVQNTFKKQQQQQLQPQQQQQQQQPNQLALQFSAPQLRRTGIPPKPQQQQQQQQAIANLSSKRVNSTQQQPVQWSPLEVHKDYLPQKWLFWAPTGILTGASSYWLKISPIAILFRQLFLYAGIILAWVVGSDLVPSFDHTCCYNPHVKRRDLGHCDDPYSRISQEPIGMLRVHCGSYPLSLHIWIIVTCSSFLLALCMLYGYEWNHVKRMYRRRVDNVKSLIDGIQQDSVGMKESVMEELETCVMLAVNSTSTVSATGHFWAAFLFLEFYTTGIFLRAFLIRWLTRILLILHFVSFVVYLIIRYEEDLYQAWWRCYPAGTSLSNLKHGTCSVTLFPRSPVWGMWIIILCSLQATAFVLYSASVDEEYGDQKHPDRVIEKKELIPYEMRNVLIEYVVGYRNSILPKPQLLPAMPTPPSSSSSMTMPKSARKTSTLSSSKEIATSKV